MTFALNVDQDVTLLVWSHQHVENLLSGPELYGFDDGRRGNVDLHVGVSHVTADLGELAAVEEAVFAGEEEGGGDEILNGGDDGFSVPWSDEVLLDAHEFEGFSSCLFRLGHVWVIR